MNGTNSRNRALVIAGTALVAIGGWLLADRVFGPIVHPLYAVLHGFGQVLWPLALIAVGIAILGRGRIEGGIAGMYRSRTDRIVGGVLGGIAGRLEVDAWIVRAIFIVFTLATGVGTGLLLYVAAMILLPEEPHAASATIPAPPIPVPAPPSAGPSGQSAG